MFAGSPSRFEIEDDIALRIESAHVPHVGVVVRSSKDVVVFRPTYAFEMNADGCPSGPGSRCDADNTRFNCEVRLRHRFIPIAKLEFVTAPKIVWDIQW